MRILFTSGTTIGGSGRSQRELAARLRSRGHRVLFLVDDDRRAAPTRWLYAHLSDASVRLGGTPVSRALATCRDLLGGRVSETLVEALPHRTTALPQNALPGVIRQFGPDVVVVSSVERWAWRRISARCAAAGVRTVLYVREVDSLGHLDTDAVPDILVANSESLAQRLTSSGHPCSFIPSVIDTTKTATQSTREVALSINPLPDKGGDLFWSVAGRLPRIPFVIQESWPLSPAQEEDIRRRLLATPNVEFRRRQPAGPSLYGDARVVLVPYRMDSRPRVILEAQANGIPVVVGDVPSLVEATGPGGLTVEMDSVDEWVAALTVLWEDATRYDDLSAAALAHARRPQADPDAITAAFERLLGVVPEEKEGAPWTSR